MYKQTERLKKQLVEITDAVNAFRSEAVQIIVADRILEHLNTDNRDRNDRHIFMPKSDMY